MILPKIKIINGKRVLVKVGFCLTAPHKKSILHTMKGIYRKTVRFRDFGRVEAADISLLPGILEDISLEGCRVRFPFSVVIDIDNDYELKIRPSRKRNSVPFLLLCHPQWCHECDGGTDIGFQILRSPDTARLNEYIAQLDEEDINSEASENTLTEHICQCV